MFGTLILLMLILLFILWIFMLLLTRLLLLLFGLLAWAFGDPLKLDGRGETAWLLLVLLLLLVAFKLEVKLFKSINPLADICPWFLFLSKELWWASAYYLLDISYL